jgi:acetyl-CoA acetyltransferase
VPDPGGEDQGSAGGRPVGLGETAENVAERYSVDRGQQDRFALRSHQRASRAAAGGLLAEEIIPVTVPGAGQATADEELKLDPELVNVNGGAIAIGHPLGCSGARITTTLLHEIRRRAAPRAAATMCIGVGQGIATLWEAA